MKILIWHGYLLGGTGSNVYTRQLAREWSRAGHDVTVLCQEPHPERFDVGGAKVVRPDVGGLLPVFVLDHYEGYRVQLLQDCSRDELDAWVEANAAAVREHGPADLVLCNHVLLGGAVGRASGARYAVKAHGSELEYSMRGRPELQAWGARGARLRNRGLRRLGAHPRGRRGRLRSRRARARGAAGCRHRGVATAAARGRARRAPRGGAASIRPIPGTPTSATRTRGTPSVSPSSSPDDEPTVVYFGKLLR